MKKILLSLFCLIFAFAFHPSTYAGLNLISTPLRYELKMSPGESVTKTAKLINKGSGTLFITTGKSNVTVEPGTGKPIFVDIGNPDQELASWINLGTNSFTIDELGDYVIQFSINVPTDAIPGGHYGVVFFQYDPSNNGALGGGGANVNMSAKYGVLLLVEVDGDLDNSGKPGGTVVGPRYASSLPIRERDNCPLGDFSGSYYDGICIDQITLDDLLGFLKGRESNREDLTSASEKDDDFGIDFNVPFDNTGNTHIKPDGNITLIDEDGNVIKGIGVENIIDENGVKIGEKITDYLPMNPEEGNVLPGTQRVFYIVWKGFPHESRDEDGKFKMDFWSPSKYYSDKYKSILNVRWPWQKLMQREVQKKITAITSIHYTDRDGVLQEFESSQDFYINYTIEYYGVNFYFFIALVIILLPIIIFFWLGFVLLCALWLIILGGVLLYLGIMLWGGILLGLGLLWFLILLFTRKKCPECKKKIKKDMKVCPYCGAILDKDVKKKERKEIAKSVLSSKKVVKKPVAKKPVAKKPAVKEPVAAKKSVVKSKAKKAVK